MRERVETTRVEPETEHSVYVPSPSGAHAGLLRRATMLHVVLSSLIFRSISVHELRWVLRRARRTRVRCAKYK